MMDLVGKKRTFCLNNYGWAYALALAKEAGWDAPGTDAPSYYPKAEAARWIGTYYGNDGQWVTDEDAANIADALECNLEAVLERSGERVPGEKSFAPKMHELVAFCREGGFLIY
jgi:hypothetical protein